MGGGASKPNNANSAAKQAKKVSAERAAASAEVLSLLESSYSDGDAAARIVALRRIDPNFKMNLMYHDEDGWSLLHVASSSRVDGERAECVKALLAYKCDTNAIASGRGRFMHEHNGSPFAYENSTPLMFAAQNGRVETIQALLEGRADINARSGDGGTALHVAAAHLQLEAARLLVDSGIDGTITSGVEVSQSQRHKKKKKKKNEKSASPRVGEQDRAEEKDDVEQAPQSSANESAQYGSGLTAAQVAAATRDAAVLAQDYVDFSLEGFALCGKMKDEVDLAEEMYQLLSAMRLVSPKPVAEVGVDSLSSDECHSDSDSDVHGGDKEEEIGVASPAR